MITHQIPSFTPRTKNADVALGVLGDFELPFYCRRMSLNLAATEESFNVLPLRRKTPLYLTDSCSAFEQSLSADLGFTTTFATNTLQIHLPHFQEKLCYHLSPSCHLSPPPHLSKRFSCLKDSRPSCNRVQLYILDSHAAETDNWRALQGKLQCTERKYKIRKLKFQREVPSRVA